MNITVLKTRQNLITPQYHHASVGIDPSWRLIFENRLVFTWVSHNLIRTEFDELTAIIWSEFAKVNNRHSDSVTQTQSAINEPAQKDAPAATGLVTMTDSDAGARPTGSVGESTAPIPSAPPTQLRTCTACRQRKVKCNRQQPCSHCIRSGYDCIYPTGRGRAPKRSRRFVDAQLVDKLARLETIIQRLASENGSNCKELQGNTDLEAEGRALPPSQVAAGATGAASETDSPQHALSGDTDDPTSALSSLEGHLGRLVVDDKKSFYVSNPLWATMTNEVSYPPRWLTPVIYMSHTKPS